MQVANPIASRYSRSSLPVRRVIAQTLNETRPGVRVDSDGGHHFCLEFLPLGRYGRECCDGQNGDRGGNRVPVSSDDA